MKKRYCHKLICLLLLCLGCSNEPSGIDKEVFIVIDLSDLLKIKPNAENIISQLGMKSDPYQGIKINVSYISDKDINSNKIIALEKESELNGNKQIRNAQIEHFKQELGICLADTNKKMILSHSIIYRMVAKNLNLLAKSKAQQKYFLLYSNLKENSDVSFYDPATVSLLETKPEKVSQRLEKQVSINSLKDIKIWLMYEPASFEDNRDYMTIVRLYKQIFEPKGATVYSENTLNL